MQVTVEQSPKAASSLQKLEEASELWPQYIRLVALLVQRSLAEFISPLLMIGLILSMSNFLLDDAIFRFSVVIPFIWAVVQCIAIDANLGFMLVRSVKNFHDQEWIKGGIFLIISLALLFVAAIIFDVEALQSVVGHLVGIIIPIDILTLIRGCAIVALVAAGPLESVSLKIKFRRNAPVTPLPQTPEPDPSEPNTGPIIPNYFEAMMIVNRLSDLVERAEEVLQPVGTTLPVSKTTLEFEAITLGGNQAEPCGTVATVVGVVGVVSTPEQEQRLQEAYELLSKQGPVRVNQLQKASGVRKETVSAWLKQREEVSA